MDRDARDTPALAQLIAPLLQRIPIEHQPLLIALAERIAAGRYREWATLVEAARRPELLACAEREDEIARRVEALIPDAQSIQAALLTAIPDFEELNRSLFAGRSLERQLAIQANGERLGAATWRSFAKRTTEPTARDTFLACADLEEASASVLESLLS